jgi:hypothetical protein
MTRSSCRVVVVSLSWSVNTPAFRTFLPFSHRLLCPIFPYVPHSVSVRFFVFGLSLSDLFRRILRLFGLGRWNIYVCARRRQEGWRLSRPQAGSTTTSYVSAGDRCTQPSMYINVKLSAEQQAAICTPIPFWWTFAPFQYNLVNYLIGDLSGLDYAVGLILCLPGANVPQSQHTADRLREHRRPVALSVFSFLPPQRCC